MGGVSFLWQGVGIRDIQALCLEQLINVSRISST